MLVADRLHCHPWDVPEFSIEWRNRAVIALSAEAEAQEDLRNRG